MPLYPAAALMVGWLWDRVLRTRQGSRWIGIPIGILVVVATTLAVGFLILPRRLTVGRLDVASRVDTLVPSNPWQLGGLGLLLVVGATGLWWVWRRGRSGVAFGVLVATQAMVLLAVATVRAPAYEARYPVRTLATRVRDAVPPGQPVLSLLRQESLLVVFYLRDPAAKLSVALPELLAARGQWAEPRYALVDGDTLTPEPPGVHTIAETRFDSRRVLLVRVDPFR